MQRVDVRDEFDALPSSGGFALAMFVPSLGAGGAERVMVRLANTITSLGVHVDLLVGNPEGVLSSQVSPAVRVFHLGAKRVLYCMPSIVKYLRQEKPQAFLSTMAHANIVAIWSRLFAHQRSRLVVREATTLSESHRSARRLKEKSMLLLARYFYRWADTVVAPSKGVAEDLLRLKVVPPHKLHVIYNPVVTPDLFEKSKEEPEHPWLQQKSCPVILSVGRLVPAKDYPTLIRAFDRVRSSQTAKLIILGEGEERERLQELVRSLHLEQEVSLPGIVANPYSFMKRADVYVLSSRWEGMPNALVEAVALGIPVVSTDCPSGPREILEEGRLGKLVPVGDAEKMAEAILEALIAPPEVEVSSIHQRFGAVPVAQAYLRLLGGAA